MIELGAAVTPADMADAAGLFRLYAASIGVDLGYQGFEAELAGLPGKYAPPGGALLLARGPDGTPCGCVAVRALTPGSCELKRLFVLPHARGGGLGRRLVDAAIAEATRLGHAEMRLDTLPDMQSAATMYRRLGFAPIPPYYDTPIAGTLFMAKRLDGSAGLGKGA